MQCCVYNVGVLIPQRSKQMIRQAYYQTFRRASARAVVAPAAQEQAPAPANDGNEANVVIEPAIDRIVLDEEYDSDYENGWVGYDDLVNLQDDEDVLANILANIPAVEDVD